jgi:hypothetical protein
MNWTKMGVIKVRKDVTNTARQIFGNSEGSWQGHVVLGHDLRQRKFSDFDVNDDPWKRRKIKCRTIRLSDCEDEK